MTGMVASSQRYASEVGARVLREGGTAADACIAMDAMLHVTEPASTSLGGDMFALHFDARTSQISALNGSGRSPRTRMLDDVIGLELLAQEADKAGLTSSRTLAAQVELQRMQSVARAMATDHIAKNPPNDAALRAIYEENLPRLAGEQYRLRHIN